MQTQGSLQESDLASLLQTMQSERATGTLVLEDGTGGASLFFLFGHLFHATDGDGDGEDVVVRALGWRDGTFRFDPRAKLPADETIRSSPAELIAAAGRSGDAEAPTVEPKADTAPSLRAIVGDAGDAHPAATDAPAWVPAASTPAASAPTASAPDNGGNGTVMPAIAPAYVPVEFSPTYVPAEAPPMAAGAARGTPVGTLPIPAGTIQYAGLKTAFVDFARLLRTLRSDSHTGFIRLVNGASSGVLLFRDGEVVEAEAGDDGTAHGEEAFLLVRDQMDSGDGLLDVVGLDDDTVSSVARLLTGPPLFTGLLARFVDFAALLEYLAEERLDGSMIVVGASETGVILLREGAVLAAYTAAAPAPQTGTDTVSALAAERTARIEVRGDDSGRGVIDTEAALSRPR